MMNFHGHKSFHAYLLPDVKLALQCTHQGIHVCPHYSGGSLKNFRSKKKMNRITTSDLYSTFKKAPQPDTSDLPSKTYTHDNKIIASNIAR
jgi:hypothetical protein